MTKTDNILAALIALAMLAILLLSLPAQACTPDHGIGLLCPDDIPAVYVDVCEDGCFLLHRDDLHDLKSAEAISLLVPELQLQIDQLIGHTRTLQDQRDYANERGDLAVEDLHQMAWDLGKANEALASRPTWVDVGLGVIAGVVVGYGANELLDIFEVLK